MLGTYDGERTHGVATQGLPSALADARETIAVIDAQNRVRRASEPDRALRPIADTDDESLPRGDPLGRMPCDSAGTRTIAVVPLREDQTYSVGIYIYRRRSVPSPTNRSRFCRISPPRQ